MILCKEFNAKTKDGRDMSVLSSMLDESIKTIVGSKEQSDLEAFIKGECDFSTLKTGRMDDFELICFLVVRLCLACRNLRVSRSR